MRSKHPGISMIWVRKINGLFLLQTILCSYNYLVSYLLKRSGLCLIFIKRFIFVCLLLIFSNSLFAQGPFSVTGLVNKQVYRDNVSFKVTISEGFSGSAYLNGEGIEFGKEYNISKMDYYELFLVATNLSTHVITNQCVQFILLSSDRGDPEKGLIKWILYPDIPSSTSELDGAKINVICPKKYPSTIPMPVVIWITEQDGKTRRVNGNVIGSGNDNFDIKIHRGVGSGVIQPKSVNNNEINVKFFIKNLSSEKVITLDESPLWTDISGVISSNTTWTSNSLIHLTNHLTITLNAELKIEEGVVVLLDPLVNITNNGIIRIKGTIDNPVVFTARAEVEPEKHENAWGGFIMRGSNAVLITENSIFVGGGGAKSFSVSPGSSHRQEQPVFLIQSGAQLLMTNTTVINSAGQIGNGYYADMTLDHCLFQKAITAGEYVGGTITIKNSALIEFPFDDGFVNSSIADADYDAIYFVEGTHIIVDSLIGWAKDDAIDSGSGGAGTVLVTNCWIESVLHEGLAWSGGGRVTWAYDSVLINNGQGLECGWSGADNSPLCYGDGLLILANGVGVRFGDNYDWSYYGFVQVTNSIILYNYRDVWGFSWNDWVYHTEKMDIQQNLISSVNTNHPNNRLWNPETDAEKLQRFLPRGFVVPVGIGLAIRTNILTYSSAEAGIPVRLSSFTSKPVGIDYQCSSSSGTTLNGHLEFKPGETVKLIIFDKDTLSRLDIIRVSLLNPSNCEITGLSNVWVVAVPEIDAGDLEVLVASGSVWKYLDTGASPGQYWKNLDFNDSMWPSGKAILGYGENDLGTVISYGTSPANKFITYYFRKSFWVDDVSSLGWLILDIKRDDGAVVYINGKEVLRSNMPDGDIDDKTLAYLATDDGKVFYSTNITASILTNGTNIIAVEVHQESPQSSDISFDLELYAVRPPTNSNYRIYYNWNKDSLVLGWQNINSWLETANELTGPWLPVCKGGFTILPLTNDMRRFFRLRNY
jgi:hypothetical protein